MGKPLCIDLFCGLGGWSEGFISEGWDVVGFDIERHVYVGGILDGSSIKVPGISWSGSDNPGYNAKAMNGTAAKRMKEGPQVIHKYPAQLVLQDVLTLHGRQFRNADCIVASPPCQEFSYMAMPWSRAKQIALALREGESDLFPEGYAGSRTLPELTALFDACFRIQREACEAAGRHIPMVVENVKGAQPWVGRAKANFGSFYFWGDVAMVGGQVVAGSVPRFGQTVKAAKRGMKRNPDGTEHPQGSWFAIADSKERGANGVKVEGFNFHQFEKTGKPGGSFQTAAVNRQVDIVQFVAKNYPEELGTALNGGKGFVTGLGMGHDWRQDPSGRFNSKSDSRKAASAQIAKIPFPLASYIAQSYHP